MGEHRVRVRGSSRRSSDPDSTQSPEVRVLLHRLSQADYAPAPRENFRDELRAQLVAITPRVVAEGSELDAGPVRAATPPVRSRLARVLAGRRPDGRIGWARPIGVAAAVLTICAVLLGGAVWMSRDSLPGDALYGLKRASENVQLSLADTPADKAKVYLKLAWTRTTEAQDLLRHADAAGPGTTASGISANTASQVSSTLTSGDSDVRNAAQLLGQRAIATRSGSGLSTMTAWAPAELTALHSVLDRLPSGTAAHRKASSSVQLVEQAQARAQELQGLGRCGCLATAPTDDLGPIPCTACSTSSPHSSPAGTPSSHPRTSRSGSAPTSGTTGNPGAGSGGNGSGGNGGSAPPSSGPPGPGSSSGSGGNGGGLPTLPVSPPSLPIRTGSCGLHVSLGPITAGAGTCGVGVGI